MAIKIVINRKIQKATKIFFYLSFCLTFTITTINHIPNLYNAYCNCVQSIAKNNIDSKVALLTIIIILSCLCSFLYLIVLNERSNKRNAELRFLNDRLTEIIENEKDKISLIKMKDQELNELRQKLNQKTKSENDSKIKIYETIRKSINANKSLNNDEWVMVEDLFDKVFPEFKTKLFGIYVMKEREYRVSMLTKLGFLNAEIAAIMCRSTSAISLTRANLIKKITGEDKSSKDFDAFIKNL